MAGFSLPLGVRFRSTKLQLVEYFLATRLSGQELPEWYPQFLDFDVYTDHPFNILASTKERRRVNDIDEGFFFCRLSKLTPNGKRISRCIKGIGTWSEKAGINEVCNGDTVVGIEKYLKFKPVGKSNNNNEDEWTMHEYYRNGNDEMVLCHITKKPVSTKRMMIMPTDYEASSSKRGRIEYEQPSSGCNNSGIINPNQDYGSPAVDEGYQVEYCRVPQGNEALTKEIEGMREDDGILQLTELGDHQVYDMEPLLEQAEHGLSLSNGAQEGDAQMSYTEDIDQFVQDAEQPFGLPNGEQNNTSTGLGDTWTAGCNSSNAFGADDLDLDISTLNVADLIWLLETPIATA